MLRQAPEVFNTAPRAILLRVPMKILVPRIEVIFVIISGAGPDEFTIYSGHYTPVTDRNPQPLYANRQNRKRGLRIVLTSAPSRARVP